VLPRQQKTRGRFYLFTAYEINRGRTRWAFYPSKGAACVCRFMRQVRRWYPGVAVWVALDRDSPHPCKARVTRRVMRRLGLRWITLPKGSPDDNPVETIFSDVQQMILDNSDDPDARAMQRRISAHLRGRNRRRGRRIRIPYLADCHKH
jgi:transposase